MDAADIGWSVLKAPLVPGSLRQTRQGRYEAEFRDPLGEIEPMNAGVGTPNRVDLHDETEPFRPTGDWEGVSAWMNHGRANVGAHRHPDWLHFEVMSSDVEKPLRREGRATALYDMIAAIIEREHRTARLYADSRGRSLAAQALWEAVSPDDEWRLRHDLWGDGYRVLKAVEFTPWFGERPFHAYRAIPTSALDEVLSEGAFLDLCRKIMFAPILILER